MTRALPKLTDDDIATIGSDLEHAPADICGTFWRDNNRRRDKRLAILACYAIASACAKSLRLEGRIGQAQIYEQHCEGHYRALPEACRW